MLLLSQICGQQHRVPHNLSQHFARYKNQRRLSFCSLYVVYVKSSTCLVAVRFVAITTTDIYVGSALIAVYYVLAVCQHCGGHQQCVVGLRSLPAYCYSGYGELCDTCARKLPQTRSSVSNIVNEVSISVHFIVV